MRFTQEKHNNVTVITLADEVLDVGMVTRFRRELTPVLKSEYRVVFDMRNVFFVDSSGVGLILSCLRTLNAEGGDLKICALNKSVRALFELVRMHKILDIFENKEEAVAGF